MAIDLSNATANFGLDQIYDNKFPASSSLVIRTGAVAGAENADAGTALVTITTPATPFSAAASGSKSKNGTWSNAASATGTAGHYRLTGTTTTNIEEGTCGTSGADMNLDNTSIATVQTVTVTTYTRTL
jgi:hypothetical protein